MDNPYLSPTGRYIFITPKYKILNPTHESTVSKYEGPIENYELKYQKKNLEEIQNVLLEIGSPLTYIYVGKFLGDQRIKTTFLAHSENRRFWWYKYDGITEGSGTNEIYVDGKKYKLSSWLKKKILL